MTIQRQKYDGVDIFTFYFFNDRFNFSITFGH
jgi:hypothetical protein